MSDDNVVNFGKAKLGKLLPASKRRRLSELEALKQAEIDIVAESRAYAYLAILTLAEICDDGESDSVRVSAANSLLDRGFGKPQQGIDMKVSKPKTPTAISDEMSDDEAAAAYADTLNS